jgi:putative FmdB family regulatory protein
MPIYEYKCKKCGENFELKRSIWDPKKDIKCPKCGDQDVDRVFSSFSMDSNSGSCSSQSFG